MNKQVVSAPRHVNDLGCLLLTAVLTASGASQARGGDGVFDLQSLPLGKSVTIPRPATTLVPMKERVQLGATDLPQSVSFRVVMGAGQSLTEPVKIAIYDDDAERVRYVLVRPGTPFVYPMRKLARIVVIPQQGPHSAKLQVESDKPLEIAR